MRVAISVSTMKYRRALISGDNVVGFGSVLIDPLEGNMCDYLAFTRTHARAA